MTFLPRHKGLMSLGADSTAIVWNLAAVLNKLPGLPAKLEEKELDERWKDLASDNGVKATAAVWGLIAAAEQGVPLMREKLNKAELQEDVKKVPQLIKDLDADEFTVREKATKNLESLGRSAEQAMRDARQTSPPWR